MTDKHNWSTEAQGRGAVSYLSTRIFYLTLIPITAVESVMYKNCAVVTDVVTLFTHVLVAAGT